MKNSLNKILILAVVVVLLSVVGIFAYQALNNGETNNQNGRVGAITNFEECAAAGHPVLEVYPARCITPEGETFTQEVGWEDDGLPTPPTPNGMIPPAANEVQAFAANEYGTMNVRVLSAEYNEFSDGCLGLAAEDEMCTQVITPGYRVTLNVDGQEVVYRTDTSGNTIRKEN
jgi:hypothetical protein